MGPGGGHGQCSHWRWYFRPALAIRRRVRTLDAVIAPKREYPPAVRLFRFHFHHDQICLAFPGYQSDQSSCAVSGAERIHRTTMKNVEATTTETAAAVAQQGATVAPEKASSKKGATQKKGA